MRESFYTFHLCKRQPHCGEYRNCVSGWESVAGKGEHHREAKPRVYQQQPEGKHPSKHLNPPCEVTKDATHGNGSGTPRSAASLTCERSATASHSCACAAREIGIAWPIRRLSARPVPRRWSPVRRGLPSPDCPGCCWRMSTRKSLRLRSIPRSARRENRICRTISSTRTRSRRAARLRTRPRPRLRRLRQVRPELSTRRCKALRVQPSPREWSKDPRTSSPHMRIQPVFL